MIRLGYWAVGLLLHGVVVAASAENAVNPADARRVVAHRLQLPAPKNAFEAWVADMTLWAALGCARGASLDEELRLLEKVRLHKKRDPTVLRKKAKLPCAPPWQNSLLQRVGE